MLHLPRSCIALTLVFIIAVASNSASAVVVGLRGPSIAAGNFTEDFSTNPYSNGRWQIFRQNYDSGIWANGEFYLTRDIRWQSSIMFAYYSLTAKTWEATFRYRSGGQSNGACGDRGGDGIFFFFYSNSFVPGPGRIGIPNEGYSVKLDTYTGRYCDVVPGELINYVAVKKNKDPYNSVLKAVADSRVEDNQWHKVDIRFDNGRILVSIDGDLLIDYQIESPDYSYSTIGFHAITGDASNDQVIDDFSISSTCEVPFFWQGDPNGIKNHPLRGTCDTKFDTIGEGGCTLTSATMLFRYYGADTTTNGTTMTPPNLSDCMNTQACPFDWKRAADCSNEKALNPKRYTSFSYTQLNQELNQNRRPVILQMCRPKGACNSQSRQTHWVLVVGGQGVDPENYTIWDPWFECGQNMRLNSRSETWDFIGLAVYDGTPTCNFSTEVPLCARSVSPVGLPSGPNLTIVEHNTATPLNLAASSAVSGTATLYRTTNLTMTVHLAAQSSVGNVTDMLIWSDTISNTIWQPFAPYVWLPLSDFVYARFRDNKGNISDVVSDTPNPSAPPVAPDHTRLYLPLVTRQ